MIRLFFNAMAHTRTRTHIIWFINLFTSLPLNDWILYYWNQLLKFNWIIMENIGKFGSDHMQRSIRRSNWKWLHLSKCDIYYCSWYFFFRSNNQIRDILFSILGVQYFFLPFSFWNGWHLNNFRYYMHFNSNPALTTKDDYVHGIW